MIFNWEFYLYKNPDLLENGIKTEEESISHFQLFGMKEQRIYTDICIFFNWQEYIKSSKDLKDIDTEEEAWRHFLYHFKKEKREINNIYILKKYCI